ncbi:hypothetical protein BUALT_Bualt02G0094800 [Buddleja alternifolia]|uniref:Uncharacterized protein n=1 Tax=Buddleja alternifolia TaxID=168488 RepID=A0AAV6XZA9_9LAMI|nr:hypothetical protein BUALT_Bualt02G0094800 [Buddleja alternifolia]
MAETYRKCIPMLPLLIIACIYLSKYTATAELMQISQSTKPNGPVTFLAVGDWGRKGAFNQSAVARAVISCIYMYSMGDIGGKLSIDFVVSSGDNFYMDGLSEDLKKAIRTSNAAWKIVVGYHPLRSIAFHGDTKELLHQLLPILQVHTNISIRAQMYYNVFQI